MGMAYHKPATTCGEPSHKQKYEVPSCPNYSHNLYKTITHPRLQNQVMHHIQVLRNHLQILIPIPLFKTLQVVLVLLANGATT